VDGINIATNRNYKVESMCNLWTSSLNPNIFSLYLCILNFKKLSTHFILLSQTEKKLNAQLVALVDCNI